MWAAIIEFLKAIFTWKRSGDGEHRADFAAVSTGWQKFAAALQKELEDTRDELKSTQAEGRKTRDSMFAMVKSLRRDLKITREKQEQCEHERSIDHAEIVRLTKLVESKQ